MPPSLVARFRRKMRLIKTRKKIAKGENHEIGWDLSTVHKYWRERNKHDEKTPFGFAGPVGSNEFKAKYFSQLVNKLGISKEDSFLELGPSAGYVLSDLYKKGYHNLSAIETNPKALNLMKQLFPETYNGCKLFNGIFEEILPSIDDNMYSVIFSMGVLMHVHPSSNFIFEHIARISKKYIIVIEQENAIYNRIFPRNYKKIFENLGFIQVLCEMTGKKIKDYGNFPCRVFQKV